METLVNICKILGLVALMIFLIKIIGSMIGTTIKNIVNHKKKKKFINEQFPKILDELVKELKKETKTTEKPKKTTKKTTKKDSE